MLEIMQAQTLSDFQAFRGLLDEMAEWDATETRATGQDPEVLLADCYSGDAEVLQAQFTSSGAAMFLAHHGGRLAGCAGFSPADGMGAELEKLFSRPEYRGFGIGSGLLGRVMAEMRAQGYQSVRLETVTFMTAAIRLYRSFGFAEVPAFRPPLGNLVAKSVFMGCDLRVSNIR